LTGVRVFLEDIVQTAQVTQIGLFKHGNSQNCLLGECS